MKTNYKNILLVEDDSTIGNILEEHLPRLINNITIFAACNGNEGLDVLNKKHIDLAIINLAMPCKDGYEMIRDIRNSGSDLPIIVMSGHVNNMNVEHYLPKPCEFDQLISSIEKALPSISRRTC